MQLVEAARGCSLLIHEATFEDEMGEDAARKKHSTTGEALQMGDEVRMQHAFKCTVLYCMRV